MRRQFATVVLFIVSAAFLDTEARQTQPKVPRHQETWASEDLDEILAVLKSPASLRDLLTERLGPDWMSPSTASPTKLAESLLHGLFGSSLVEKRLAAISSRLASGSSLADSVSPYWRFIPQYEGSAVMGGSFSFSTNCFSNVTVSADSATSNSSTTETLGLSVTATGLTNPGCKSDWWFTTAGTKQAGLHAEADITGVRVTIKVDSLTPSQRWMMNQYGIRIYTHNVTGTLDLISSLIDTVILFLPSAVSKWIGPTVELANMEYLNTFAQFQPPVTFRANPGITGLNESDISDGDILFCSDMKGLGTTISIGTGGTSNHVTMALRGDDGVLRVCESTDPVIRCTVYSEWIVEATNVSKTVVLAPLAPRFRANFNRTAAWIWINNTLGVSYGYSTFFFGWIDTANDNLPCFAPDFKRCFAWEHLEFGLAFVSELVPSLADLFYGQALNHRVNASGLSFTEVLQRAYETSGLHGGDVMALPEQDAWRYKTWRNGIPTTDISNVCSTWTCNTLKHAGIFVGTAAEGTIQCGEQDPWNMEALKLFDPAKTGANRPTVCQQRDPQNSFCVLTGKTTFHLGIRANSKPLTARTGEKCGGVNPFYNRSNDC